MPRQSQHAPFPAIVVVGASAGGVEALTRLARELPEDLALPVLVILHVSPAGTSVLADILDRAGALPARAVQDGDPIEPGRIHVAPPDRHLLVTDGHLALTRTPRENGHRPAVDPTLRSAAAIYGSRAVGVILSGAGDDGSLGLAHVKRAGGIALAQDPDEALYDGMPRSAAERVDVDAVLPIAAIAAELGRIATQAATAGASAPAGLDTSPAASGRGTRFTCPDCGGVLFEHHADAVVRYRCSVGHAYGEDSLDAEQERVLENALWAAVRSLGDRAELLDRMAERARGRLQERSATQFEERAGECRERADVIREAIERTHSTVLRG